MCVEDGGGGGLRLLMPLFCCFLLPLSIISVCVPCQRVHSAIEREQAQKGNDAQCDSCIRSTYIAYTTCLSYQLTGQRRRHFILLLFLLAPPHSPDYQSDRLCDDCINYCISLFSFIYLCPVDLPKQAKLVSHQTVANRKRAPKSIEETEDTVCCAVI